MLVIYLIYWLVTLEKFENGSITSHFSPWVTLVDTKIIRQGLK